MRSRAKVRTKVIIAMETIAFFILLYTFFIRPLESFILIVLILYDLRSKADILIIDSTGITVKNWLTFEKRNYLYSEFDKVVIHRDPIENFGRHNIYLLKGETIFNKLSGRNFDNLDDLMTEIEKRKTESNRFD